MQAEYLSYSRHIRGNVCVPHFPLNFRPLQHRDQLSMQIGHLPPPPCASPSYLIHPVHLRRPPSPPHIGLSIPHISASLASAQVHVDGGPYDRGEAHGEGHEAQHPLGRVPTLFLHRERLNTTRATSRGWVIPFQGLWVSLYWGAGARG